MSIHIGVTFWHIYIYIYIYERTEYMNYYASENPKQWGGGMSDRKVNIETENVIWEIHTKRMDGKEIRKYRRDQGRDYRNQEVTAG